MVLFGVLRYRFGSCAEPALAHAGFSDDWRNTFFDEFEPVRCARGVLTRPRVQKYRRTAAHAGFLQKHGVSTTPGSKNNDVLQLFS